MSGGEDKRAPSWADDQLGPLNRHWYRRCLDSLDALLSRSSASPGEGEKAKLCDAIVTSFLTAVTGQAANSPLVQFPAERAYFIPFAEDKAERFNYSRSFFQVLGEPPAAFARDGMKHSLWGFMPWAQGADGTPAPVRVDYRMSVSDGETVRFRDVVSARTAFMARDYSPPSSQGRDGADQEPEGGGQELEDGGQEPERGDPELEGGDPELEGGGQELEGGGQELEGGGQELEGGGQELEGSDAGASDAEQPDALWVRKALLLRADEDLPSFARSVSAEINNAARRALIAAFEIYRETPGNSAVEHLLLNHLAMIRWATAAASSSATELSQRREQLARQFDRLLELYFLEKDPLPADHKVGDSSGAKSGLSPTRTGELLKSLRRFLEIDGGGTAGDDKPTTEVLLDALLAQRSTRFLAGLSDASRRLVDKHQAEKDENKKKAISLNSARTDALAVLRNMKPDLASFAEQFLSPGREAELADELGALLGDQLLRAGHQQTDDESQHQSFVWVCRDYGRMNASLQGQHKVPEERKERVQQLYRYLTRPYELFFKAHDRACLHAQNDSVSAYWRTLQEPNRRIRLFSSFPDDHLRLATPDLVPLGGAESAELLLPRPQTLFLRVRICDSLNEPQIDGLFAFTTDHDEVRVRGKHGELREEDARDLLAFSKVFFFVVRDYFRAADRTQDARDIGRLNQNLYERRLTLLDDSLQTLAARPSFKTRGVTTASVRRRLVYEVVNEYAVSLVEKPPTVRAETFPYDRLLVMPLDGEEERSWDIRDKDAHGAPRDVGRMFDLPFFLFQGIFVERNDGAVAGDHFSLIKPFQSPVDRLERQDTGGESATRFRVKSFQQAVEQSGEVVRLTEYLEKHYLGSDDRRATDRRGDDVVVTADRRTEDRRGDGEQVHGHEVRSPAAGKEPAKTGASWARKALRSFVRRWSGPGQGAAALEAWEAFLTELTADHQRLADMDRDDEEQSAFDLRRSLFLVFRFSLLRLFLCAEREIGGAPLADVKRQYTNVWRTRFDERKELNVWDLAAADTADPLAGLRSLDELLRRAGQKDTFAEFSEAEVGADSPLLLAFFEHLSDLVRNERLTASPQTDDGKEDAPPPPPLEDQPTTWYQGLLTRATGAQGEGETMHRAAAAKIAERGPQYPKIREGKDSLKLFVGLAQSRAVGAEERTLRSLVVMVRDYDDTLTGAGISPTEMQVRLDDDIRDLKMFSGSYYRAVGRFVQQAIADHANQTLSGDISQIARNWYSSGVDQIVDSLQVRLDELERRNAAGVLRALQPSMADGFFDAVVKVLLRRERKPGAAGERSVIALESFPFDRILHVPLSSRDLPGSRLGYTRTTIRGPGWEAATGPEVYANISKKGRTWDTELEDLERKSQEVRPWRDGLTGKVVVEGGARLGLVPTAEQHPLGGAAQVEDDQRLAAHAGLDALFVRLAQPDQLTDLSLRFASLPRLQTLAIAGLLRHLLKRRLAADAATRTATGEPTDATLPTETRDGLERLAGRLGDEIAEAVRGVERSGDAGGGIGVRSDVYLAEGLRLDRLDEGSSVGSPIQPDRLPGLRAFMAAVEGAGHRYGLPEEAGGAARSRAYIVYYSFDSPRFFPEVPDDDARYRGLFLLLVDNEAYDRPDEARKVADQQDIRTLVHNSVANLRLVLERQAVLHQSRQPGAESFVIAVLHRIKNEMSFPAIALGLARKVVPPKSDLSEDIDDAIQRIEDLTKTFQDLKGLSEAAAGWLPLESFSTSWLALRYIEHLQGHARKALETRGEADIASGQRDLLVARLEEVARAVGHLLTDDDPIDEVQRQLFMLAGVLGDFLPGVQFSLSLQVFATGPLTFRGSHHWEEAFRILVENAFQATWAWAAQESAQAAAQVPRQKGESERPPARARLQLFAESSDGGDEVLLRFRNSTREIGQSVLEQLQAETPTSISAQRHAAGSGKRGGSGFGHYHARRIVSTLCGGREHRRNLDIRFEWQEGETHAWTTVNLLAARPLQPKVVKVGDVLALASARANQKLQRPAGLDESASCLFPGELHARDLLAVIEELLDAEQRRVVAHLRSLAKSIWMAVMDGVVEMRSAVSAALSDSDDRLVREAALRIRPTGASRHSAGSLERLLEPLRRVVPESLRKLGVPATISPLALIDGHRFEEFDEDFGPLAPYVLDPDGQGWRLLLDDDRARALGHEGISDGTIAAKLCDVELVVRLPRKAGRLVLQFDLVAKDASNRRHVRMKPLDLEIVQGHFKKERVMRAFMQYAAALTTAGLGELRFEVDDGTREMFTKTTDKWQSRGGGPANRPKRGFVLELAIQEGEK